MTAVSTSTAGALDLAFSYKGTSGADQAGGATAEATAIGVSGDGADRDEDKDSDFSIKLFSITRTTSKQDAAPTGNDTITNNAAVTAVSTAVSGSGTVSISVKGAAAGKTKSTAKSLATAVDAGNGDDTVTNNAALTAVSTATAGSIGVGFSEGNKGEANAAATAESEAYGVRGDGTEASTVSDSSLDIRLFSLDTSSFDEKTGAVGNDTITNNAAVTALSTAVSGTGGAGVSVKKTSKGDASSTAKSVAVGVEAGAGNDTVTNNAAVTAVSTATAGSIGFGFSEAAKGEAKAGGTAEADAIGIRGDGKEASSVKETSLHIGLDGISGLFRQETTASTGNDTISNFGAVTAVATAVSGSESAAFSIKGASSADMTSTAKARSAGIDAGNGDDTVTNVGAVTTVSTATAGALGIGVAEGDQSNAKATVTAEAEAFGIRGDGAERSSLNEATLDIGILDNRAGLRFERTGSSGTDTISNAGAVTAISTAVSGGGSAAISAKKAGKAEGTSTAKALAVGIEGGGGNDGITNTGAITAVSTATSGSIGFGFSEAARGTADLGSTAEAEAVGVRGDGTDTSHVTDARLAISLYGLDSAISYDRIASTGTDTIDNSVAVTAVSTATSGTGAVAVSLKNVGDAKATSTAKSRAAAIDAGAGGDTVNNSGALTAVSTAVSAATSLALTESNKSAANANTVAQSTAVGISGDGALGSAAFDAGLALNIRGLDAGIRYTQSSASGDDTITNSGAVTAVSNAVSGSGSVGIGLSGAASADGKSQATSLAAGIDAGSGGDTVNNSGVLTSVSTATAAAITAAVAGKGNATNFASIWDGGSSADATATGITGDSTGQDFSTNTTLNISVFDLSVDAAHETRYVQVGGDDEITNDGVITASAVATAPSVDVSVALDGVSGALSTAKAKAKAVGMDGGTANDDVTNNGVVVATSAATAAAINVSVAKREAFSADALWDGSTTAEAEAIGLGGDGEGRDWVASGRLAADVDGVRLGAQLSSTVVSGDDEISNTGTVVATSAAIAPVVGVAASAESVGIAMATSEARSRAAGIDAGSGSDKVNNEIGGVVVSSSLASAAALNVGVSKSDALAGNMFFDGDTQANSEAVGISGDGQGRDWNADASAEITLESVTLGTTLSTTVAGGNDDITNDGTVAASSVALVPSVGIAVSVEGVSGAVATSEAQSRAVGIDAGTGDDTAVNNGELIVSSLATAGDVNVAVSKQIALADNSLFDGGTTARSQAIGISGDGEGRDWQAKGAIEITDDAVRLGTDLSTTVVSGTDTITNDGTIVASSVALAPSLAAAISVEGVAAATSSAEAHAQSSGIDAGAGGDEVTNRGSIVSSSLATAAVANVSVSKALAVSTGAAFDGGTLANANAVGISGDGEGRDWRALGGIEVNEEATRIGGSLSSTVVSGEDTITNEGTIVASAGAIAPAIDVAVALQGVGAALSKATAIAEATGIDAGSGNDTVDHSGTIVATAAANADAISVAVSPAGVALAGGAVWDGATTASSRATGISGDGEGRDWQADGVIEVTEDATRLGTTLSSTVVTGDDTIINDGSIVATSVSLAPSLGVAVALEGVAGSVSTASADAKAAGIDAGAGNDMVDSTGDIVSTAVANADAINISVTPAGVAIATDALWDGGTTATAESVGISGDGEGRDWNAEGGIEVTDDAVRLGARLSTTEVSGKDTITNSGTIASTSVAASLSAGVAVALEGVAAAASTATAESRSTAIDAGAGGDSIDNSGALVSSSVANANALAVSVTPAGAAFAAPASFEGGTTAVSEAIGISGDGRGRDWLAEGSIEVEKDVTRIGSRLSSTVVSGDDIIINDGTIVASSAALAPSVGVSVAVAGVAGTVATATADSSATAVDAGSGNDRITNNGRLVASSVANADALGVSVTPAGVALSVDAIWEGGTEATSRAVGISGDGEGRDWLAEGGIESSDEGVTVGGLLSTTTVAGKDWIDNTGDMVVSSAALAPSVNVSVAVYGVGGAVSAASADSTAIALEAGGGGDTINNSGTLVSTSLANADAISATVVVGGVAVAGGSFFDGGTSATSESVGISGDGEGRDWIASSRIASDPSAIEFDTRLSSSVAGGNDTIFNSGDVVATSASAAIAENVSLAVFGVSGAITAAEAESRSAAIDAGTGGDTVTNEGTLVSTSLSAAVTKAVALAPFGVAIAANDFWDGGTEARSEALGISADGDGQDWLAEGKIEVSAEQVTRSNELSISQAGGNDTIFNSGTVVATAAAEAPAVTGAGSLIGASAAISTAAAEARAATIDAGAGNDFVDNSGELVSTSVANANTVNVAVSLGGVAIASDAVWTGGTSASSEAIGISGDGKGRDLAVEEIIDIDDDSVVLGTVLSSDVVGGTDTIINDGKITATSVSVAPSISAAVSVVGGSAALSNATANARAAAIDAGAGGDNVTNDGELVATSVANADAIALSVGLGGGAVAGNSFWDGGTRATAAATGISADGAGVDDSVTSTIEVDGEGVHLSNVLAREAASGIDEIDNTGNVTATAVAAAPAIAGTLTVAGVGAAVATSEAEATALALDAGAGGDTIINSGELVSTAVANAISIRSVTTLAGVAAAADSVWDGGTSAAAEAIGIGGDGVGRNETIQSTIDVVDGDVHVGSEYSNVSPDGNDRIFNTGDVTATSVIVAPSVSVASTAIGSSVALSTATAHGRSIAIDAGAGNDEVDNSGNLNAASVANADAISVAFALAGVAVASDAVWDGGTTATAEAIGIAGDRAVSDSSIAASVDVVDGSVRIGVLTTEDDVGGRDIIDNSGEINATAVAVAPSISIASGLVGGAAALTTSTAESRAAAIDAGSGVDIITNNGPLRATSFSNADAISFAQLLVGVSAAGTAAWDGGPTALAEAIGISGDGHGSSTSTDRFVEFIDGDIRILEETVRENVGGNDIITNTGSILADADAIGVSADVALTGVGMAAAVSTSEAHARAAAIDAGGGGDLIDNSGELIVDADAVAVSVAAAVTGAGLSVAADAVWDSGTTAEAEAVGISGDGDSDDEVSVRGIAIEDGVVTLVDETEAEDAGGMDIIDNSAAMTVTADANTTSVGVSATGLGVTTAIMTGDAQARSRGIESGGGQDTIDNLGEIRAISTATANTVTAAVTGVGVAFSADTFWDGGTKAAADATGIHAGAGDDDIDSQAMIGARAVANTTSTALAVTAAGGVGAFSAATADARSTGIDAADGKDLIVNNAPLNSQAEANAVGTAVSLVIGGFADTDTSANATATAIGIDGGAGTDEAVNANTIWATATASGTAAEVEVSGVDLAAGVIPLDSQTRARSDAIGIDGGAGEDVLDNDAAIVLDSRATTSATDVDVTIVGFSNADISTTVEAFGTGLGGGADNDEVSNNGVVAGSANGTARARAVPVGGLGPATTDLSVSATGALTGLSGDGGNDSVVNNGLVDLASTASAPATSVAVNFAGTIVADVSTNAIAETEGLSGGDGRDELINAGMVRLSSVSEAPATSVTVEMIGESSSASTASATSAAIGMAGDGGDDTIVNLGSIDIASQNPATEYSSNATASVRGASIQIVGATGQVSVATAGANVTGIDAGEGDDFVVNMGTAHVRSVADADVAGGSFTLGGTATVAGTATAVADATGIAGGSGVDLLYNEHSLHVEAESGISSTGIVSATFGAAGSDARVHGAVRSAGISGGDDDDEIVNLGSIDVGGSLFGSATGLAWTLGGSVGSTVGMSSSSSLVGLDGGDGGDLLYNAGDTTVTSVLSTVVSNSSWVLAGAANDAGSFSTSGNATGIRGGRGQDEIINGGIVDVDVFTSLSAQSGSGAIFGEAGAGVSLTADSLATGIDGAAENDVIVNLRTLDVLARTTATSDTSALAVIGNAAAAASLAANADARGILGGAGADQIANDLVVGVTAVTALTAPSQASAPIGTAQTSLNASASAFATGIDGEDGADEIQNNGSVFVSAVSSLTASGQASVVIGNANSQVGSSADARATGLAGGTGDDMLLNRGTIASSAFALPTTENGIGGAGFVANEVATSTATASSNATVVSLGDGGNMLVNEGLLSGLAGGNANADANAAGGWIISLNVPAVANTHAAVVAPTVIGIAGGSGSNQLVNEGALTVAASPASTATARANGSGAFAGTGTATASGTAQDAVATGIRLGAGDNSVRNSGTLLVVASPNATAQANSDADGFSFSNPDSTASATATANNALSVGIEVGNGNNEIVNEGTLTVSTAPVALQAAANAASGNIEVGIDAFATATARANDARAYGIRTGGGSNAIRNSGFITVSTEPSANAAANAQGVGFWGVIGDARATASANNALAVGIQTGSGDDDINNEGSITVRVEPMATADASSTVVVPLLGIRSCVLNSCIALERESASNARAIGILSGAGDDVVWNTGTITAVIGPAGSTNYGVGVDLGAGADTLVLLEGSQILGSAFGGTGDDTLMVDGVASVNRLVGGFETLSLVGPSNLIVQNLEPVAQLQVDEGTLNVTRNYTMLPDSTFRAQVNADGSNGQLIAGPVTRLDGNLTVAMGTGVFVDGTTYDIVRSSGLEGDFLTRTLPATGLVSFDTARMSNRYEVTANVAAMTSVASASLPDQTFAAQLDGMARIAVGDTELLLAQMQRMPSAAEVRTTISDLNPANYGVLTESTLAMVDTHMEGIEHRVASLRSANNSLPFAGRGQLFSYEEGRGVSVRSGSGSGAWAALVTQVADVGGLSGNRGLVGETMEMMTGIDFDIGGESIFGVAFGSTLAMGALDAGGITSGNTIDGYLMSLYGGHRLGEHVHLNAQLSYAEHHFTGTRLPTDELHFTRAYEQNSDAFAAKFELGRDFVYGGLRPEAYTSISYRRLNEESFDEVGAYGLSLSVDERDTMSLETELGMRIARSFDTAAGMLHPRLDMAWVHDFYAGENAVTAHFSDLPDYRFDVPIGVRGSDALRFGGGIDLIGGKFMLTLGFETDLRHGTDRSAAKLEFRQSF